MREMKSSVLAILGLAMMATQVQGANRDASIQCTQMTDNLPYFEVEVGRVDMNLWNQEQHGWITISKNDGVSTTVATAHAVALLDSEGSTVRFDGRVTGALFFDYPSPVGFEFGASLGLNDGSESAMWCLVRQAEGSSN